MAKTLRGLRDGFNIDDLAEVVWDPDNGRTGTLLEVPEVLELGFEVYKPRTVAPGQLDLFGDSPAPTWPRFDHLAQLWQVLA